MKEQVYMYSLMEGDKPFCGVTTNTGRGNVIHDVMHSFDRPRFVRVELLPDMAVDENGNIYGPVPVPKPIAKPMTSTRPPAARFPRRMQKAAAAAR